MGKALKGWSEEMMTWLPENSIVDPDVALMARKGVITEFNIIEQQESVFYVTMRLNWRPDVMHLATRRERDKPRTFMHLGRLVKHIRENYQGVVETNLILSPQTPEAPKKPTKKPAAATKKSSKKPLKKT